MNAITAKEFNNAYPIGTRMTYTDLQGNKSEVRTRTKADGTTVRMTGTHIPGNINRLEPVPQSIWRVEYVPAWEFRHRHGDAYWIVTNDKRSFEAEDEDDAIWLLDLLSTNKTRTIASISELITADIREDYGLNAWDDDGLPAISPDEAYSAGMRNAVRIAKKYEAKFGWQPAAKAGKAWHMVRDTVDGVPYPAHYYGRGAWADAGGDQYSDVTPLEYYKIPGRPK